MQFLCHQLFADGLGYRLSDLGLIFDPAEHDKLSRLSAIKAEREETVGCNSLDARQVERLFRVTYLQPFQDGKIATRPDNSQSICQTDWLMRKTRIRYPILNDEAFMSAKKRPRLIRDHMSNSSINRLASIARIVYGRMLHG